MTREDIMYQVRERVGRQMWGKILWSIELSTGI